MECNFSTNDVILLKYLLSNFILLYVNNIGNILYDFYRNNNTIVHYNDLVQAE